MDSNFENDLVKFVVRHGLYSAYPDGRVFNHTTKRFINSEQDNGYARVTIRIPQRLFECAMQELKGLNLNDGERSKKNIYTHRFIFIALKGPIPVGYRIHHLNELRNDNRLENLDVMTIRENTLHSIGNRSKGSYAIEVSSDGIMTLPEEARTSMGIEHGGQVKMKRSGQRWIIAPNY